MIISSALPPKKRHFFPHINSQLENIALQVDEIEKSYQGKLNCRLKKFKEIRRMGYENCNSLVAMKKKEKIEQKRIMTKNLLRWISQDMTMLQEYRENSQVLYLSKLENSH